MRTIVEAMLADAAVSRVLEVTVQLWQLWGSCLGLNVVHNATHSWSYIPLDPVIFRPP